MYLNIIIKKLNAIYKKMCILHVLSLGFRTFRGKCTFL